MKLQGKSANLVIGAMLVCAAIAVAFWVLALSPKRDEASKLSAQVKQLESSLAQHRAEAAAAEEARKSFPVDYQRLVVMGKAVPGGDETASLLVQLNRIADAAGVRFQTLTLESSGSKGEAASAAPSPGGEPVSATEAAASLLPLGASIGPAGLAVMPYALTFEGSFFTIADFIKGLDSLVKTTNEKVAVDGRLITVDGFSLSESPEAKFPALQGAFSVTTYLTPPSQGVTAGASPSGPEAASTATPVSTTTGGAPWSGWDRS
jgi:Tfp pilus assembly protein PilO